MKVLLLLCALVAAASATMNICGIGCSDWVACCPGMQCGAGAGFHCNKRGPVDGCLKKEVSQEMAVERDNTVSERSERSGSIAPAGDYEWYKLGSAGSSRISNVSATIRVPPAVPTVTTESITNAVFITDPGNSHWQAGFFVLFGLACNGLGATDRWLGYVYFSHDTGAWVSAPFPAPVNTDLSFVIQHTYGGAGTSTLSVTYNGQVYSSSFVDSTASVTVLKTNIATSGVNDCLGYTNANHKHYVSGLSLGRVDGTVTTSWGTDPTNWGQATLTSNCGFTHSTASGGVASLGPA
jgi:hypothetical protein